MEWIGALASDGAVNSATEAAILTYRAASEAGYAAAIKGPGEIGLAEGRNDIVFTH